jgi:hypothetical protein
MINTSYTMINTGIYSGVKQSESVQETTGTFMDAMAKAGEEKTTEKKSGHIEESMQKYPEYASHWKSVIAKGHQITEADPPVKPREEMTMEEYKSYIGGLIDKIPVDISQSSTEFSFVISDEAWETMKDDPDFEAYVVGGLEHNLTYRNPWMVPPRVKRYCVLQIGVPMENGSGSSWGDLSYGTTADSDAHFRKLSKGESFRKKPDPQVIKQIEAKRLEEKRQKTEREKKLVEKQRRAREDYKNLIRKRADEAGLEEFYDTPNSVLQAYESLFGIGVGML